MKPFRLFLGLALVCTFLVLNLYTGMNHWSIWFCELLLTLFVGYILNPLKSEMKDEILNKTLTLPKLASVEHGTTEVEKVKQRLELVIEGTNDGIWDWNVLTNRVFWAERLYKVMNIAPSTLGNNFDVLKNMMHPTDRLEFEKALRSHLVYNTPFHLEIRIRTTPTAEFKYYLARGKVKHNQDGKPIRMAGSISDISERKAIEKKLYHTAYHDSLTNLYNRSFFLQMLLDLQNELFDSDDRIYGLILIDLDKFKNVNDNYGYSAGDQLLMDLSDRLKQCLKAGDELARIGGNEFAILIPKIQHAGDATRQATRIRQLLQKAFHINRKEICVSACIGIVFSSESDSGTELLLRDANTVMNIAKGKGQGVIEIFKKEMREDVQVKFKLEYDLRHAINRKEIYLVYQPIYRLSDTKLQGFEALIRWQHKELGNISPVKFIPLAEETGLILPIGEWVFRTACQQLKDWLDAGLDVGFMSINVAAPQLYLQDVPSMIQRIAADIGVDAQKVKIEITESAAMNDVEKTISTLNKISDLGFKISIDDFGTGYSSLAYLKRFPINTLKVDRSFVTDIPHDQDSMSIASTIIAMAKTLNLDIIAEGVEDEEQVDFLVENECDYVQGFFFSKPLFVEECRQLLDEQAKIYGESKVENIQVSAS